MKDKIMSGALAICCLIQLTGCIREEAYANDPQGNFEQLWKIIDEQYCFLDFKGIDWDEVKARTQENIYPEMDENNLFYVLDGMLSELQDGHVNLTSDFNQTHFSIQDNSPAGNFDAMILESETYLGKNFHTASGMKYRILRDNIGYIYYESFQNSIAEDEFSEVLRQLSNCDGLIIDVRQNGGGNATNSARIASRFVHKRTLTGYICHKTGPGHNDFSDPYAIYLEPANGFRWQKKVVVLTNRHSYSATNDFVNHMKGLPNVTIIGDKTGGGAGMPFTSELPNGWTVRFSASPHFDDQMRCTEWGILPDKKVDMSTKDKEKIVDTIIEEARKFLHQ